MTFTPSWRRPSKVREGGANPIDGLRLAYDVGDAASYPGAGAVCYDLSGFNNHASLIGATYSADGGGSFTFSGSSRGVLTNNVISGLSAFTVIAYVKATLGTDQAIFSYAGTGNYMFDTILALESGGSLIFQVNNGSDGNFSWSYAAYSTKWTHIAAVFDGSDSVNLNRAKMYINGAFVSPIYVGYTYPSTANASNTTAVFGNYINSLGGWALSGRLSILRLHNKALTAAEAANSYNFYQKRFV